MLPKLKYYLTNWIDGMKINRQHFLDSENAIIDQIRDVSAYTLNTTNYGLLQPLQGEKTSLDCTVLTTNSNTSKINVSYCRAVTSGGCRIEIIPGLHPELISDNDVFTDINNLDNTSNTSYYAVISVNPFDRQPFGTAMTEEYPPRNQYSISTYKLSLVPESSLNAPSIGPYHLPVAKFSFKSDKLTRDTNYIPPCAIVGAHPGTKEIYNTIAERLNSLQENSFQIIHKVIENDQNTTLALNMKNICTKSMEHISSEFFSFRTIYRQQSPVYIANSVIKLANIISLSLGLMSAREKEELLQYFSYWIEISPGKFEELLTTVVNADYEHENIHTFFQPLLAFLKIWNDLLDKLKDLKLIGQKNEKFDFGGRTMETPKDKGKGKFNILE